MLLALSACVPLPPGTAHPTVTRSDLPNAFEQCPVEDVIEDAANRYYVLACQKIAIYQCNDAPEGECAVVAAGTREEVLPEASSPEAVKNKATRLFEFGREIAKEGRLLEACDLFAESDGLFRTFGSAMNLGDCEASDGHLKGAWYLYNAAAEIAEKVGEDRLVKFARGRESAMRAKLCTLVITIPDPTLPGLQIRVGQRLLDPASTIRTVVEPRATTVVIDGASAQPFQRTIPCTAGGNFKINVPGNLAMASAPP